LSRACVVLATTRADVNGIVRKYLGARKISFASDWPILIDVNVIDRDRVIVGSGIRASKLLLAAEALASLPNAEVLAITKPVA